MLLDVTVNTVKVTSEGDKVEEVSKSFKKKKGRKKENLKFKAGIFFVHCLPFGAA